MLFRKFKQNTRFVPLQVGFGEHQNFLIDPLRRLLRVKPGGQCSHRFDFIPPGCPPLCGAVFLPELELGRKRLYSQPGKGTFRQLDLAQKTEPLFHLADQLFIHKWVGQKGLWDNER